MWWNILKNTEGVSMLRFFTYFRDLLGMKAIASANPMVTSSIRESPLTTYSGEIVNIDANKVVEIFQEVNQDLKNNISNCPDNDIVSIILFKRYWQVKSGMDSRGTVNAKGIIVDLVEFRRIVKTMFSLFDAGNISIDFDLNSSLSKNITDGLPQMVTLVIGEGQDRYVSREYLSDLLLPYTAQCRPIVHKSSNSNICIQVFAGGDIPLFDKYFTLFMYVLNAERDDSRVGNYVSHWKLLGKEGMEVSAVELEGEIFNYVFQRVRNATAYYSWKSQDENFVASYRGGVKVNVRNFGMSISEFENKYGKISDERYARERWDGEKVV